MTARRKLYMDWGALDLRHIGSLYVESSVQRYR